MNLKNKASKRSAIFIFVFIIGIIAMALLMLIGIVQKFSPIILGAQGFVLLCLIFLLSSTISSRRKIIEQNRERENSPYGSVDKKEIDRIFEMIDKEEKRRGRSLAFLAGSSSKMEPPQNTDTPEVKEDSAVSPEKNDVPSSGSAEDDEDKLPIIFPDKDEYEGDSKPFSPISEERAAARKLEKEKEKEENAQAEAEKGSSADEIADLVAAASLGAAAGEIITVETADNTAMPDERKQKGKRGKGGKNMDNRPKKRPPVYYDQYGNPIAAPVRSAPAQPVGYDQYGRPIYQRPPQRKPHPIGFDQNGRPIYPPPQRKPRAPIGYDQYGRPIYAPAPGGRPRPAGARPPQRRRPAAPGVEQAAAAPVQQIPTEPMATSAADALSALEATQAAGGNQYYDEDYIPVVVHMEEDFEYTDDRYTPRIQGNTPAAAAPVAAPIDEYNASGSNAYVPDYASEDIPVVVPVFEDMEVDYSSSRRGFTPMSEQYGQKNYAPPGYNPEPPRETPLAPTSIYQDPTHANPEYNAKSAADYTRDDDEEHFVYVPHFDDDDPIPVKAPEAPKVPHWKLAKMRRRKVTRRSRRGMLFKVMSDSFSEYMQALKSE